MTIDELPMRLNIAARTATHNELNEGICARWWGRASNPVGDGIRSRAGSTPAAFRQASPKVKDRKM